MPQRQLDLDFNTRRQVLRRIQTGNPHVKHLLRVIDDHSGEHDCWLSVPTIAREMEVCTRTVQRAIETAVKQELLIVLSPAETGRTCNTFRIRWAEMRDRTRQQEDERRAARERRSRGVTQSHPPPDTESPPPVTVSPGG